MSDFLGMDFSKIAKNFSFKDLLPMLGGVLGGPLLGMLLGTFQNISNKPTEVAGAPGNTTGTPQGEQTFNSADSLIPV